VTQLTTIDAEVRLTPAAAARVAVIATRQAVPARLRLSVEGGGCSGFTYKFGMADGVEADDHISVTNGTELLIDSISLDLLRGSEVDFVDNLGGTRFEVRNPNAASGCGCGSSFSV
jgi:iron-sulfur cluster insertion protein